MLDIQLKGYDTKTITMYVESASGEAIGFYVYTLTADEQKQATIDPLSVQDIMVREGTKKAAEMDKFIPTNDAVKEYLDTYAQSRVDALAVDALAVVEIPT